MFDDSKEAIRTARSIYRSKLIEVLKQVDDNKHPQVEITESNKELPSLYADWVRADMERVFKQTVIETNPKVEEQKEFQEKVQGVSSEEEQIV